jgi:hypothetical protein
MTTKLRSFRFPEDKLKLLKEIAEREHNGNQTQALLEAIERYYLQLDPPVIQGYIRLDKTSPENGNNGCRQCKQTLDSGAWIAFYSDGTLDGAICGHCVEGEEE